MFEGLAVATPRRARGSCYMVVRCVQHRVGASDLVVGEPERLAFCQGPTGTQPFVRGRGEADIVDWFSERYSTLRHGRALVVCLLLQ